MSSVAARTDVLKVRFICCEHTYEQRELPTRDSEGFLACPIHGMRRFGWRTVRMKLYKAHPFDAAKPQYVERPAWSETDIERDRAIVGYLFPNAETPEDLMVNRTFVLTDEEIEMLGR